jgi:hypothetical protein
MNFWFYNLVFLAKALPRLLSVEVPIDVQQEKPVAMNTPDIRKQSRLRLFFMIKPFN